MKFTMLEVTQEGGFVVVFEFPALRHFSDEGG